MKPHLKMWRGKWMCTYGNFYEIADTPAEAYSKLAFYSKLKNHAQSNYRGK